MAGKEVHICVARRVNVQRYTLCTMCEDSSCVEMGLSIARRLRTPRCISALSRDSGHSRYCLRAVRVSSTTPDGKAMKIFNSDIAFNLSKENDSSLNSGVNGEVRVTSRVYALIHSEMWLSALKWLLTEICITPSRTERESVARRVPLRADILFSQKKLSCFSANPSNFSLMGISANLFCYFWTIFFLFH